MVIQFSEEKALKFLLENNHVFTLRLKKRIRVGNDWANVKRGAKKFADVFIIYFGVIENAKFGKLKNYAEYSGFKNVADWITAVKNLAKGKDYSTCYLYHVKIRELFEEGLKN